MNRFGSLIASRQFLLRKTNLLKPKFISTSAPKSSAAPATAEKVVEKQLTAAQLKAKHLDEMSTLDFFIWHEG